ncbi:MAG: PAS domain-containing protein [Armatimonadia bacterium]
MVRGREQKSRAAEKKLVRQRIVETAQAAVWEGFREQRWMRLLARVFALVALVFGGVSTLWWVTGRLDVMTEMIAVSRVAPMAPATSLGVLLLAIGVLALANGRPKAFPIAYAVAGIVLLISTVRLVELISGVMILQQLFPPIMGDAHRGGWMGFPSVIGLSLGSLALLLPRHRDLYRAVLALSMMLMVLGAAFALGYVYGRPLLYQGSFVPLRLPTSICFLLLGAGLLAVAVTHERAISRLIDEKVGKYQQSLEALTRQLQQERWLLSTIIESVPLGLALHDGRDLTVKWHNQEYTRLFAREYRGKSLVGTRIRDYTPEAHELEQAYELSAAGQRQGVSEYRVQTEGAEPRYYDWATVPVTTEDEDYYDVLEVAYEVTEQVKTRQKTEELARELEAVIDYAPNGIMFFNAEGRVVRINPAGRAMLGFTREVMRLEEPEPMPLLEIRDEAGNVLPMEASARYRALRGETVLGEVQNAHPPGREPFWASVSAVPIWQEEGVLAGAVLVVTDVTGLYEAQWEAQRLSSELQTILDHAPNGILVYDVKGNIQRINQAARDILGYTDDVVGLSAMERFEKHEVLDDEGQPMRPHIGLVAEALQGAIVHNQIARFQNTPRGSLWLSASAGPILDQEGEISGVVAVFADVTALKLAQDQLQEAATHSEQQRQELETIVSSIVDGVLVFGADGRVERANEAARKMMPGYAEVGLGQEILPDIKEKTVAIADEQMNPVAFNEIPLTRAMQGEVLQNINLHVTWPDGSTRWVSVSAAPIFDEHGAVERVVTVFRDVTHVREHQQELEQQVAQRTEALVRNQKRLRAAAAELAGAEAKERQRLSAAIHDEVAQTLGAIKMYLSLMRRECPTSEARITEISAMVDEANQQSRAVMAELSPPALQRLGLSEALRWWAGEVKRRHGLEVLVEEVRDVGRLEVYLEATMFQAAKELIQNVLKHAQTTRAEIGLQCQEGRLQLWVRDEGVGFDPAVVEAKSEGFGLFSIRERMSYVGGDFELRTSPGGGTEVRLELPSVCGEQGKPEKADEKLVEA